MSNENQIDSGGLEGHINGLLVFLRSIDRANQNFEPRIATLDSTQIASTIVALETADNLLTALSQNLSNVQQAIVVRKNALAVLTDRVHRHAGDISRADFVANQLSRH